MPGDRFRVRITNEAKEMVRRIAKKYGRKTYEVLRGLVRDLEFEPEKKGQPLRGPLRGLHSLHYSRFRVVYRIERDEAVVLVLAAGYHRSDSRSDVYKLIERLVEKGHLEIRPGDGDVS